MERCSLDPIGQDGLDVAGVEGDQIERFFVCSGGRAHRRSWRGVFANHRLWRRALLEFLIDDYWWSLIGLVAVVGGWVVVTGVRVGVGRVVVGGGVSVAIAIVEAAVKPWVDSRAIKAVAGAEGRTVAVSAAESANACGSHAGCSAAAGVGGSAASGVCSSPSGVP